MEDAVTRTEEKKRRNKCCIYIFIFVVVVIIAGVGAYFGTRGSSTDNAEGEATPIADQGDSPIAATSFNPTTTTSSKIPTSVPLFDPPSEEDCAAIANGDALTNQEKAIADEFNLAIDVTFVPTSDTDMNDALMDELMNVIQQYLMPLLVGCVVEDSRRLDAPVIRGSRKLQTSLRYVILNAIANGEYLAEEFCEEDAEAWCYRVSVNLQLFLKEETINFIAADFDGTDCNKFRPDN
jgi:hypothetical protein